MQKTKAVSKKHLFVYPILEWKPTDGDTVKLLMDMGFDTNVRMSCRLDGVDAPESNTNAGQLVMLVSEYWMKQFPSLSVNSVKKDKYAGRFLGVIFYPADKKPPCLNFYLLENKLARVYKGGARPSWTPEELKAVEDIAYPLLEKFSGQRRSSIESEISSRLVP